MHSSETVSFSAATRARRSRRALKATSSVPDSVIVDLVESTLLNVPSAFNSQTTRISILLHDNHRKLWTLTGDVLLNEIGEKLYTARNGHMPSTKEKMATFGNAYGTILFWDDLAAIKQFKDEAPGIYKDKCEEWATQSNGMHQYHIWVALETFGLGASLQHYNPLVDEHVRKIWGQPAEWALRAQMVFGTPVPGAPLPEKIQKVPVEKRLNVFGAIIENGT
ncbi:type II nitroreductase [Cladophialophora chaetospira]|uniref:Type II nitroreductase n=1 Tax=Cladophialophora chaetospira TaxID=386627 RepID=A0AA38XH19_9EURO|nr:type II nitroreductase [Cladophialophora chaetospira]